MALDTRGFMGGFAQGFGMMDQYQHRQWQKEQAEKEAALREKRLGIQDQRYKEERDFQRQQYQDTLDHREFQAGLQKKELGLKEAQHQQQSAINQHRIDQAKSKKQRTEDENYLKGLYADWGSTGDASVTDPQELKRLEQISSRSPDLVAAPIRKTLQQRRAFAANKEQREATVAAMQKLFTPGESLTPADEDALANANTDISRAAAPEAVQATQIIDRVFDPQDDFNENSPEALEAWNLVFGDMVGEGKRIAGVYPGKTPGTITLDLDTGDGDTKPMTANRGTEDDGDNDVLEIPVDKAIETVSGFKAVAYQFALDDEARNQALDFAARRGLYAAPKADQQADSGEYRREVMGEYRKAYQRLITDTALLPEEKQQAIQDLKAHTSKSLGIHPTQFDRFEALNAHAPIDNQTRLSLMQPYSGGNPDQLQSETESPDATQPQPAQSQQPAGLSPPDRPAYMDNPAYRSADQIRADIERQNQERAQKADQKWQAEQQRQSKQQRQADIAAIQQRLQKLAPAVQAGDPAAQKLAQQLTANMRDLMNL